MNRRAFLNTTLASLAAALVLDPERALWVPGKKLITLGRQPIPVYLQNLYTPYDGLVMTRLSAYSGEHGLSFDCMQEFPTWAQLADALAKFRQAARVRGFPPLAATIARYPPKFPTVAWLNHESVLFPEFPTPPLGVELRAREVPPAPPYGER